MPRKGRNIYKRKDNRWEARVYFAGSKKYKAVYAKTYKEAARKQDKLRLEMGITNRKDYLIPTLAESWLEDKSFTVKEGTLHAYSCKLKNHILPYFSDIYFSKLTEQMLSGFVAAKRAEGLSAKYISDMVIIIKSVSAWAYKRHGFPDKIRDFKNIKQTVKEPEMLNHEEQKKLQNYLLNQNDDVAIGIFTSMYTGLRIGEICALKWSDIDIENETISISKTLQRLPNSETGRTEVKLCTPKTPTSVRTIPIPKFLVDTLEQNRQHDSHFVLSNALKPIEPRCLTNKFKKILAETDLPTVKFHSLRHLFASNCIQNNFDAKTLSEILGHSNPNITLRIYLHSSIEQKRKCMERLTLC